MTTVLHIAPTPFFANRGCHIRIRNEMEALAGRSVRTLVCTYSHGQDPAGLEVHRIPNLPGYRKTDAGFSPYKFLADALLFLLVLRVSLREKPDLLHGHLHEGVLIGWAVRTALFWRRIPLLMDVQGSLSGELEAYGTFRRLPWLLALFRLVERLVCRLPDHFVCSSESSLRGLIDDFGVPAAQCSLLDDVVPEHFFALRPGTRPADGPVPAGRKVVLYSGSLLPGKGINHVLQAIRRLAARRPDLFFILVGYPVDEAEFFLRLHGLTGSCLLTGEVDYKELPRWLELADLALEPKAENSGEASGKTLHYMAAALPVVCFDLPNNHAFLGDAGYFARPGSEDAFVQRIEEALADEQEARARGLRGRELVKARFSLDSAGKTLVGVYDRLLGKKGRAPAEPPWRTL